MPDTITKNTLIPVGAVVTFIGVLIGSLIWLTTVYAQVISNGKAIEEIKEDKKAYESVVRSIDKRLSNIEGRLDIKLKKGE